VSRPPKAVSDYMAKIGKKGGETKGGAKKRSPEHYKRAAAKRWAKRKPVNQRSENERTTSTVYLARRVP